MPLQQTPPKALELDSNPPSILNDSQHTALRAHAATAAPQRTNDRRVELNACVWVKVRPALVAAPHRRRRHTLREAGAACTHHQRAQSMRHQRPNVWVAD
eukprot:357579-Chlamydomonas_euryale.AAC.1